MLTLTAQNCWRRKGGVFLISFSLGLFVIQLPFLKARLDKIFSLPVRLTF